MKSRQFSENDREIVLLAHNIRSILNVGSILRTAECFAVSQVFATGYTPNLEYSCHSIDPTLSSRARPSDLVAKSPQSLREIYQPLLPHIRAKLSRELHKTALGAEEIVDFKFRENIFDLISELRKKGFAIIGLEQDSHAIPLPEFNNFFAKTSPENFRENIKNPRKNSTKFALILGEEVIGITPDLRETCDFLVEIPMFGHKESLNVSVATGICLYELLILR